MDVIAIHTALVAIWPDGIPREQYVALAGIFKVCGDLEIAALRERMQREAVVEGDPAKFMNVIPFTHHPNGLKIENPTYDMQIAEQFLKPPPPVSLREVARPLIGSARSQGSASPGPRKGARAFVSEKTVGRVRVLLAGGKRTQRYIVTALDMSPRAIRYALRVLQDRKIVKRLPSIQGPSLYELV